MFKHTHKDRLTNAHRDIHTHTHTHIHRRIHTGTQTDAHKRHILYTHTAGPTRTHIHTLAQCVNSEKGGVDVNKSERARETAAEVVETKS